MADTIEQLVVEYIQQEGSPQKAAQAFAIKTMDNTPPGSQARAVQVACAVAKEHHPQQPGQLRTLVHMQGSMSKFYDGDITNLESS